MLRPSGTDNQRGFAAVSRMRLTYICALGAIALVTISAQLYLHRAVDRKGVEATAINVAGRQRMLSQRVAKASLELTIARSAEEHQRSLAELEHTLGLMNRSQAALRARDGTLQLTGRNPPEIEALYAALEGPLGALASATEELLALASAGRLEGESSEEAVALAHSISARSSVFLPEMDAIVNAHESLSQAHVEELKRFELTLAAITLMLLLLEAMLVFEPAVRTIRVALKRAHDASVAKGNFLANMSHEIRTPMTAILGYTDLLQSDDLIRADKPGAREAVRTIRSNGQHLLTVINDILDMSKIESGKMTVESTRTNPAQIAEEVASLLGPKATGKSIGLGVSYAGPVPKFIASDPTRLRQILLNLAGNAIKFTAEGEVRLTVGYDTESSGLTFEVRDTGVGMNADQLRVIREFGAFTQADETTTRTFGGTGLGLCISNTFARMMGGSIEVDSRQGEGSVFTLRLTAEPEGGGDTLELVAPTDVQEFLRGDSAAPASGTQGDSESQLGGLRVLLAEDGPDNQRLLSHLLRRAGALVTIAENGVVAVNAIEAASASGEPFDVVLMDMQMPEMDGYTATRLLRNRGFTALPVVALTAHAMASDRQECLDAGCDGFVSKPVTSAALIEAPREHGERGRRSQAA